MFFSASPCRFCLIAFAALVSAGTAMAQSEAERAEKWFRTLAIEAAEGFKSRSFKMNFTMEIVEKADPSEIAAIRAKVANLPAHPDRARLQRLEHLQKYGPAKYEQTLWFRRGDMRLNRSGELSVSGSEYVDTVSYGEVGWKMTPQTLFVVPTGAKAKPGHNVQMVTNSALYEVKNFFGAGLGGVKDLPAETSFEMLGSDRWRVAIPMTVGDKPRLLEIRGTWDSGQGRGRLVESDLSSVGSGAMVLYHVAADAWSEFHGVELATVVTATQIANAGLASDARIYKLLSSEPTSDQEFESVAAVPAIDAVDPSRGPVTFTMVENLAGSEPNYTLKDPRTGDLTTLSYSQTPIGSARQSYRIAGWICAGGIVLVLGVLRVRNRS